MRINEETMKCVVFIGIETERGGFVPLGTGFIIAYQLGQFQFTFVATAAHVVENLSDEAKARVAIRLNRLDGKAMSVRPDLSRVLVHENPSNDVMLIALQVDPTIVEVIAIHGNREEIEGRRQATLNEGTMPGDTVAAIGLYTSHHGTEKNAPVLRTGNIAAIAGEPIFMGARGYAPAHLIELRTFAGLSGSPVFQTVGPVRIRDGQPWYRNEDTSAGLILGILVGYHCVEDKDDIIRVPRHGPQAAGATGDQYSADERNTGFGVVIPIERIFEIFERDDVQRGFKNSIEIVQRAAGFRPAAD